MSSASHTTLNGVLRRGIPLAQPPGFRRISSAVPAIDPHALAAVRALNESVEDRTALYHTRGSRRTVA